MTVLDKEKNFGKVSAISGNVVLENAISFRHSMVRDRKLPEDEPDKENGLTLKQKITLCLLSAASFISFCSMSIMAPFFPKEAANKNMSETVSGFVFSFYALVMFVSAPIIGRIVPVLGVRVVFVVGLMTSGICCSIFGTLAYVEDYTTFAALAFGLRGIEALGASAQSTAEYVIVFHEFPNHGGTVRGILETFVGLGLSVGPALGGFLFHLGGFGLPFYVLGFVTLSVGVMNMMLQVDSDADVLERPDKGKGGSFQKIVQLPSILICCLIIMVISITWSFPDSTLEPHLRKFSMSPANIGLIFLLLSTTYGICSPPFGWAVDRMENYWYLNVGGLFFSGVSLLFLGPSPLLYFIDDSISLNVAALSALGVFVAMGLMPTFQGLHNAAIEGGYGDNLVTQGTVSGLWSGAYSLGEVIGPGLGGAVLERYGFPVTTTVIAAINFAAAFIAAVYYVSRTRKNVVCDNDCDGNLVVKESYAVRSE